MGRFVIISIGVVFGGCLIINGCSAATDDDLYTCNPEAIIPDPWCLDHAVNNADAGADGNADAASVIDDPGLESSVFPPKNSCVGDCVPEASAPYAIDWPYEPLVVWFGSKSELDTMKCPAETPYEKVRGYDNLVAPPAKCAACACLAEGTCTGLPASIDLRSGTCNTSTAGTTSFDGPPNWDGSCTSINAMAAGTQCSGVLCAQSVSASPLPPPTNESCIASTEKPTATIEKYEWLEGALACHAQDREGTCLATPEHCVGRLPEGWFHCLARTGKHDVCPDNYDEIGPRWVYQDNPIDDRGCSDCACGTPMDGICIGAMRLYSDASCTAEINRYQVASTGALCADLQPPGLALGSKKIGELAYWPGTCAAAGGEPMGGAKVNEMDGAVTFCCRAPSPPLPTAPG